MSEARSLLVAALGGTVLVPCSRGCIFDQAIDREGCCSGTRGVLCKEDRERLRNEVSRNLGCYSKEDVAVDVIENDGEREKEVPYVSFRGASGI